MIAQGFDEPRPRSEEGTQPHYATAGTDYPGPVILLADPDPDSRVIFSTILRYRGFRPVAVDRGEEALRAAHTLSPKLAILDLGIGWDVVERFFDEGEMGPIPVAILSAVDLGPERKRAREMGCAVFLSKPIAPSVLVENVSVLLGPKT